MVLLRRNNLVVLMVGFLSLIAACQKDKTIPDDDFSFQKGSYKASDSVIRLMTYNIQNGFTVGVDPENKKSQGATPAYLIDLLAVIRKSKANVILLQEVPRHRCNNVIKDLIVHLADSLQMNLVYGGHGKHDACFPYKGIYGNAILTKFPVKNMETVLVYGNGPYKRKAVLKAELSVNDSLPVNFYNIHHTGEDDQEVENTVELINKSNLPVVMAGDFNRKHGDPDLARLPLSDVFNSKLPGIDRVYCIRHFKATGAAVVEGSEKISDHKAYTVVLKK
jgi:endonuclease/exonuclease/phosphatase family metal-dependent hydrolase